MTQSLNNSIDLYVNAVLGKKAIGLVILDIRDLTSVADITIICSGRSNRQVSAIANYIQTDLKKHKKRPLCVEGLKEGHWVLMDYGHVIIHVFYEPIRQFYDLEGLWADAERIKTKSLIEYEAMIEGEAEDNTEMNDDDFE